MARVARGGYHARVNTIGSTICYAYMQATGMVNDRLVQCFRHAQLQGQP